MIYDMNSGKQRHLPTELANYQVGSQCAVAVAQPNSSRSGTEIDGTNDGLRGTVDMDILGVTALGAGIKGVMNRGTALCAPVELPACNK